MTRSLRTLTRCLVCGFTEIRTDEVIDRGVVLLAECPRCDHRFTARPLALASSARSQVAPRAGVASYDVAPAA